MSLLHAILLGLIQGLTEFLPISSSGHLVIFGHILNPERSDILFDVFVHLGTLFAILLYYWRDILDLIVALKEIPTVVKAEAPRAAFMTHFGLHFFLIIGTIPIVILGLLGGGFVEQLFQNPILVCIMLLVTGLILWSSRYAPHEKTVMTTKRALLVGIGQMLALTPGISRSGTTITAALLLGIDKEECARFSFLLAVPAITGAVILTLFKASLTGFENVEWLPIIVGTLVAFGSGYAAIAFLLKVLRKGEFRYFAFYCWAIGALGLIKFIFWA